MYMNVGGRGGRRGGGDRSDRGAGGKGKGEGEGEGMLERRWSSLY